MLKRLGLSFLLISSSAYSADDCVNCGNSIEGFPTVSSVNQAACTDCNCYTETHSETISSIAPQRASSAKNKIRDAARNNNEKIVKDLAKLDQLLKKIPNTNQQSILENLKECGLDKIKEATSGCASSQNNQHIQDIFGTSSFDDYLKNLGAIFQGNTNTQETSSCLTSMEQEKINESRMILSKTKEVIEILKTNKQAFIQNFNADTSILSLEIDTNNKPLVNLRDILEGFLNIPSASAVLKDSTAFQYFINNVENFEAQPGKILDFFENDVIRISPNLQTSIVAEIGLICDDVKRNVSKLACAGDSIAFANNFEFFDKSFEYKATDHIEGFDSLFANENGQEFIDSNYVSHLFWCAGQSCSSTNFQNAVCSQVKTDQDLLDTFSAIVIGQDIDDNQNKSISSFDPNTLCKLADCQGTQAQMTACYEGVKEELGEDADSILLAYSRVTNTNPSTNSPGANYTPSQTPFAAQFLGSYSSTPAVTPTPSATQTTTVPVPNDPSGGTTTTTASSSTSSNTSSGNRVVTANQAFQQFMNQRFDSLASSPTSFPRTINTTDNHSTGTGVRVSSNESMTPRERRAMDSMNRASETIEELRESYRNSTFDRMQSYVERAAAINRDVVASSSQTNPSSITSSGINQNTAQRNLNPANVVPTSSAANVTNNIPNNVATNTASQTDADSANTNNPRSARNPSSTAQSNQAPRVQTNPEGLQTLNVSLDELPTISSNKVREEGVDTTRTFNIAVRVEREVYLVEVRPTFVAGRKILEPMLDQLSSSLKAEVLRSPLFEDYRQYLLGNIVTL